MIVYKWMDISSTFVTMEIKDRIRMIIDSHQLTAGAFADRIGVQRSNVSHILSGRNKPGYEFLEKVVKAFPKVQAHWLLTGRQAEVAHTAVVDASRPAVREVQEEPQARYGKSPSDSVGKLTDSGKNIAKIVVFYDDFSFDTYRPSE